MKQVEKQFLIDFLRRRDDRLFITAIAVIGIFFAHTECYLDGDEYIAIIQQFDKTYVYFNVTSEKNILFITELFKSKIGDSHENEDILPGESKPMNAPETFAALMSGEIVRNFVKTIENRGMRLNEIRMYSETAEIFSNTAFIDVFGIVEPISIKKYGYLKKEKQEINLPDGDEIRRLTADDSAAVDAYYDEENQYHLNYSFDELLEGEYDTIIYGYFRNAVLTSFLIPLHFYDASVWDASFVSTAPEYLGNDMAVNLAKHYINEFIDKDVFISYKYNIDDPAKMTELSAGFEPYSETYTVTLT
jgi:hypothetical protein